MQITAIVVLLSACCCSGQFGSNRLLTKVYDWNVLLYNTPAGYVSDPNYMTNDSYITGLTDDGRRFILSTPRDISYLPATLSAIPKNSSENSPLLTPYPNLYWNRPLSDPTTDCSTTIVSSPRTRRDSCNRLWVLDSGVFKVHTPVCPPKIVIFDLNTDTYVNTIFIPQEVLTPKSLTIYFVLDNVTQTSLFPGVGSPCDNVFVYIADAFGNSLIVRTPSNTFYRITDPSMTPDSRYTNFSAAGVPFSNYFGILGLTIANYRNQRSLFYTAVAQRNVYTIPTSVLQSGPPANSSNLQVKTAFTMLFQTIPLHTDASDGSVVFAQLQASSVVSWKPQLEIQVPLIVLPLILQPVEYIEQDISSDSVLYLASNKQQNFYNGIADSREKNCFLLKLTRTIPKILVL